MLEHFHESSMAVFAVAPKWQNVHVRSLSVGNAASTASLILFKSTVLSFTGDI
jgi:hypothetical protein